MSRDPARIEARAELLEAVARHSPMSIPCQAAGISGGTAWVHDHEQVQTTAARACLAAPCPVLAKCRDYGIAFPKELGVYGGLTEPERQKAARTNALEKSA